MSTPHDDYAQFIFSDTRRAAEEFAEAVGPAVRPLIDWSSLTLEPTALVDEALGRRFPDLRFSARLGDRAVLLDLIFEHQSDIDPLMVTRFFCHTGSIWNAARREERPLMPMFVNLVLHNGPRPWPGPLELWREIDGGSHFVEHAPHMLPHLPVLLDDLAKVSDEEIRGRAVSAEVKLALLALKHSRDGESVALLRRSGDLLVQASDDVNRKTAEYFLDADGRTEEQEVTMALKDVLGPKGEEMGMTAGERLRAEGRVEGLAKGRTEGRAEEAARLLLRVLEKRGLPVSAGERAQIEGCRDPALIERWVEAAVDAQSAADVFRADTTH
jgi:hypothetical protein